ncbi:MAG: DUF1611 domain-containing protein [Planctomycetes bacterium]|nr:DUF1611 domain-containing protein [Planctomycetota bacterium]
MTDEFFHLPDAKTAHGLVRGPSRFAITAVIDRHSAGRDAGEVLDGRKRGIPILADLDELLARGPRPEFLVVGVATHGGVLPNAMRGVLLRALQHGMSLVSGLHEFLADDPELVALARSKGAQLIDVRRPKPRRELRFWTGAVTAVRAPRLAVLGTDCALGKRTTCHVAQRAAAANGHRAAIVHTGQTGWLQGIPHGFVLDSTPNDFVCGELEHAIVQCDRDLAPDLILLEGQSALRNPSGPCGAELILGGQARGVLLQHAPARRDYDGHPGHRIPPIEDEIDLIGRYGARVLAVCVNHEGLAPAEHDATRAALARATGLPVVFPLLDPDTALSPALQAFVAAERRR